MLMMVCSCSCCHVQVGVAVTLEVFPRMWHDFVMYSEGCGGEDPKPLREAEVAIAHVGEFFQACQPLVDETSKEVGDELAWSELDQGRESKRP